MGILTSFSKVFKFPKVNIEKYDQNREESGANTISVPQVDKIIVPSFPTESIQGHTLYTTQLQTITSTAAGVQSGEVNLVGLSATTKKLCLKWLNMYLVHRGGVFNHARIEFRIARIIGTGDIDVWQCSLPASFNAVASADYHWNNICIYLHDMVVPTNYRLYVHWRQDAAAGTKEIQFKCDVTAYEF